MVRLLLSVVFLVSLGTFAADSAAQVRSTLRKQTGARPIGTQSSVLPQETLDRLVAREKELAAAKKRHAIATIDEALADDFHELAGDGRFYAKSDIMPMLKDVVIEDFSLSDFNVFPINSHCVMITYTSAVKGNYKGQPFPPKNALSSVWVRRSGSWRVFFHQATPTTEKAD